MLDFFLHVPKTAGRSIHAILHRNYRSDRLRPARWPGLYFPEDRNSGFPVTDKGNEPISVAALPKTDFLIFGHVPYDAIVGHRSRMRVFSVFREPVDRLISEYNHAATASHHYLFDKVGRGRMSFEDYCLSGFSLTGDNLQTRYLSGDCHNRDFGEVSSEDLVVATRNMRQLEGVGLQERFEESIVIFAHVFGWSRDSLSMERVGKNDKLLTRAEIPEDVISRVAALNAYDATLYEAAKEEFEFRMLEYRRQIADWNVPRTANSGRLNRAAQRFARAVKSNAAF